MDGRFRGDIQGLRAVAVLAVLLSHAFPAVLPGGFVGVDIFFVISGYLISGNLMREIDDGRFSILDFYRRRVRRILPALSVVTLATTIAGYFVLSPTAYAELGETVAATMLFVSNFDFRRLTGYFDGGAEVKPLLHMWSLAVEEQFYILLPPLLGFAWPRLGRSRGAALFIALSLVSLVIAELWLAGDPAAAYYLLPSRANELLIGGIVASGVLPGIADARGRTGAAALGLALMLAPMALYNSQTPFPGLASLAPCFGAALLIHAGERGASLPARLLALRPLRFVGDISYSLYLWHWPILAYLRCLQEIELTPLQGAAAIAASLIAATLSYYGVERPFLARRARAWPTLSLGFVAIAVLTALGAVVYFEDGFPKRFEARERELQAAAGDFNPLRDRCHFDGVGSPRPYAEACAFGAEGVAPDVAVWGDSHGAELAFVLGERAKAAGRSVLELTTSACPPGLDFALPTRPRCADQNRLTFAGLLADPHVRIVVLAADAVNYPDAQTFEAGMEAVAKALVGAGKQVVLFKQIPVMTFNPPAVLARLAGENADLSNVGADYASYAARSERFNAFVARLGEQLPAEVLDPAAYLCDPERCHAWNRDIGALYFEKYHLRITAVRVVFASLIERLYGATGRN